MIVVVNFKNYPAALGLDPLEVAKRLCETAKNYGVELYLSPPLLHTAEVAKALNCKVLAQKVDLKKAGATTGWIPPEAVKAAGAVGALINHSENRIPFWQIFRLLEELKKLGLISVVCGATEEEVKILAEFHPNFIAYEPPELIGSNRSVSKYKSEEILRIISEVKVPLLVGAGIKTKEDVKAAVDLGAAGILIASGILKAADPAKALEDLVTS